MTTALQDRAAEALGFFKPHPNPDRDTYALAADAPEWVSDLIRQAHGDLLPDDYRYRFIADALYALADADDPSDVEPEPDVYNTDLLAWASSSATRFAGYCEDALADWGTEAGGFTQLIAIAQIEERRDVLGLVREFLESVIATAAAISSAGTTASTVQTTATCS